MGQSPVLYSVLCSQKPTGFWNCGWGTEWWNAESFASTYCNNFKYTAWKVDGANPMYWFIIAPYEKSTFWEWLAICFHYSVSIISIHGLSWNNSQRSMIPCWVKQATTFIKSNAFTIQTGPDGSSASNFFPVSLTKTLLGLAYLQHLWRLIGSNPKKRWFWWDTRTKPGLGYKYVLNYIVLFLFIHNICIMYVYIYIYIMCFSLSIHLLYYLFTLYSLYM